MIARCWHGKVPLARAAAYHQYLIKTGLKDYASIEGNRSVSLLKKEEHDIVHFYTLTYWDSVEAIKKFAGEDYTKAKYYPEDKDYLLELETFATHYELLEHIETK